MTTTPSGWETRALGTLGHAVRLSVTPEAQTTYELWSVPSFSEGSPEIVNGSAIGSAKLRVEQGDVLICKINPRINRVWRVRDVGSTYESIASPEWLVFRPSDEVDGEYLRLCLTAPEFRNYIAESVSGVTGSHTRAKADRILRFEVPIPPLDEQRRIVAILEDHLSRLDATCHSIDRISNVAVSMRRSILAAAFRGRLLTQRYGELQPAGLPEGWRLTRIGDIVEVGPKKADLSPDTVVSFVPMPRVKEVSGQINLVDSITAGEGKRRNLTYFEDGDVIFAKITPCMENGKIALARGLTGGAAFGSTEFHVLRPSDAVDARYLRYFLVQEDFRAEAERSMTGAVGQRRVPRSFLTNYLIPLPPMDEQQRIVAVLEDHLCRLDAASHSIDRVSDVTVSLRRSLLAAAFSGRFTKEAQRV